MPTYLLAYAKSWNHKSIKLRSRFSCFKIRSHKEKINLKKTWSLNDFNFYDRSILNWKSKLNKPGSHFDLNFFVFGWSTLKKLKRDQIIWLQQTSFLTRLSDFVSQNVRSYLCPDFNLFLTFYFIYIIKSTPYLEVIKITWVYSFELAWIFANWFRNINADLFGWSLTLNHNSYDPVIASTNYLTALTTSLRSTSCLFYGTISKLSKN